MRDLNQFQPQEQPAPPPFEPFKLGEQIPQDPSRLRDVDIGPHEWLGRRMKNFKLSTLAKSGGQNILDILAIAQPVGRRPGKEHRVGETGITGLTLFPNAIELFALINELGLKPYEMTKEIGKEEGVLGIAGKSMKVPYTMTMVPRIIQGFDEAVFGKPVFPGYEDSKTPRVDAVIDFYVSRYDFTNPEVSAAFGHLIDTDPVGVVVDIFTVLALGAGTAAGGAKASASGMRALRRGTRIERAMAKVAKGTDKVDRLVRKGNYHVPGVPSEFIAKQSSKARGTKLTNKIDDAIQNRVDPNTGKLLVKTPIADLEPGVIVIKGTLGIGGGLATRAASPHKSSVNISKVQRAEDMGFGVKPILDDDGNLVGIDRLIDEDGNYLDPLSSSMSDSETVFLAEARRLKQNHPETIKQFERTVERIETKMRDILAETYESGDLTEAGKAVEAAFNQYRSDFFKAYADMIEELGDVDQLPMDLTHTRAAMREILEEAKKGQASGADEISTPYVAAFAEKLKALEDSGQLGELTDEVINNTTASGASAGSVKLDLAESGTNTRWAWSNDFKTKYQMQYELIELDDLITSHKDGITNPDFDAELQTRDADMGFVNQIAARLEPQGMISDVQKISEGAPIINDRNMVLSGNHRTMALRQTTSDYPTRWADYQATLHAIAEDYGIDVERIEGMKNPVLVRRIADDVNEAQFAIDANMTPTREMTAGEKASTDANRLDDDTLSMFDLDFDGKFDEILANQANADAVRAYLDKFKASELGGMSTEYQGRQLLNEQGLARIKNAFMRRTFQGEYGGRMLQTFLETKTQGMLNLNKAIEDAMPALADLELKIRLGEVDESLSIHEDLAHAIHKMEMLRREGAKYADFKNQAILPGMDNLSPEARTIMDIIAEGIRKPAALTEFINDYAKTARTEVPVENALFEMEAVTRSTLINRFMMKHLDDIPDDLKATLDQDLQKIMDTETEAPKADDATQDETKAGSGQAKIQVQEDVPPEYLYENADVFESILRDHIERSKRGVTNTPNLHWLQQLRNAVLVDMEETIIKRMPDKADAVKASRNYYRVGINKINGAYGEFIYENMTQKGIEGTAKHERMVLGLFSSDMDAANIKLTYELIGGFDSEAGSRVRRIVLANIFDTARTAEQRADVAAAARGEADVAPIAGKMSVSGMSRGLGKWVTAANNYSDANLRAVLGDQTVNDLNTLDAFIRSHAGFLKTARGSQTYFLLDNAITDQGENFIQAVRRIGYQVGGAVAGATIGGKAGLDVLGPDMMVAFMMGAGAWLGDLGANNIRAFMADKPISKRYLLEGTIIEMDRIARGTAQTGQGSRIQERVKRDAEAKTAQRAYEKIMNFKQ